MARQPEGGGITWTNETWNCLRGCSRVSEGCRNCYAERIAARFSGPGQPYEGLARMNNLGEPRWTGAVDFVDRVLWDPLRWTQPRRVFVNSMSDLFHEQVSDDWIDTIFAIMLLAERHVFQILTKRAERMRDYLSGPGRKSEVAEEAARQAFDAWTSKGGPRAFGHRAQWIPENGKMTVHDFTWPVPNVWLGVSVENQETADERIPLLLQTPAALRWISYEPALGGVWLDRYLRRATDESVTVDWVVAGGESGPHARPSRPDWFRTVRNQCHMAGVPFFFKQWGEHLPWDQQKGRNDFMSPDARAAGSDRVGKKRAGRLLDGREWSEFPEGSE